MTGTITLMVSDKKSVKFDTDNAESMEKAHGFFTQHTSAGAMAFDAKTQERISADKITETKEVLLVPALMGG